MGWRRFSLRDTCDSVIAANDWQTDRFELPGVQRRQITKLSALARQVSWSGMPHGMSDGSSGGIGFTRTRYAGLADDRQQRAGALLPVIRDRDRAFRRDLLHHHVAAAPSHFLEFTSFQNPAGLPARKDSQSSQRQPRRG